VADTLMWKQVETGTRGKNYKLYRVSQELWNFIWRILESFCKTCDKCVQNESKMCEFLPSQRKGSTKLDDKVKALELQLSASPQKGICLLPIIDANHSRRKTRFGFTFIASLTDTSQLDSNNQKDFLQLH
jgi:hypothetical protein